MERDGERGEKIEKQGTLVKCVRQEIIRREALFGLELVADQTRIMRLVEKHSIWRL